MTAVPPAALGYLTLWPSGQPQPLVSTLNSDGRVKANAAITPAGTNGGVTVYVSDESQVILDIDGYFVPKGTVPALAFYPVTPCRVVDTRNGTGPLEGPFLAAGTSRDFPVRSSNCGVPANAQVYSLNVTAVPKSTLGYLTMWASGEPQPLVSTLNATTGVTTANAALVPAGRQRRHFCLRIERFRRGVDVDGYSQPRRRRSVALHNHSLPDRGYTESSGSSREPSSCRRAKRLRPFVDRPGIRFERDRRAIGQLGFLTLWPGKLNLRFQH